MIIIIDLDKERNLERLKKGMLISLPSENLEIEITKTGSYILIDKNDNSKVVCESKELLIDLLQD